jgi:hypothetical protein
MVFFLPGRAEAPYCVLVVLFSISWAGVNFIRRLRKPLTNPALVTASPQALRCILHEDRTPSTSNKEIALRRRCTSGPAGNPGDTKE